MKRWLISAMIFLPLAGTVSITPSQLHADNITYVGSSKSNKYHRRSCVWAGRISPKNLVVFNSPEEAISAGYVPCKVCKPPVSSNTSKMPSPKEPELALK